LSSRRISLDGGKEKKKRGGEEREKKEKKRDVNVASRKGGRVGRDLPRTSPISPHS